VAGTYPVGSLKPNKYGLYDMDGNAWEWCADWYGEEYYGKSANRNPGGPESGDKKVLRGGSWSAGIYAPLRVAYRYSIDPKQTSNLIGFRCVISPL
jgi:sulfatase modifying factor 1